MTTFQAKLRRLATLLVVVEILIFSCWFYGVGRSKVLDSFGSQLLSSDNDADLPPRPIAKETVEAVAIRIHDQTATTLPNRPSLMEQSLLKVYVYDTIPHNFTADVLEACLLNKTSVKRMPQRINNFMADVDIIRLFQNYPGRTYNPNEADIFVVPYPHKTHCICNVKPRRKQTSNHTSITLNSTITRLLSSNESSNETNVTIVQNSTTTKRKDGSLNHCPSVPQSDIDSIMASLSYYNSTTKHRHLFITSGDYGWNNLIIESQPLLLTLGPKREQSPGTIVIPYLNRLPRFQPSVLKTKDYKFDQRKYSFAYFYGKARPRKLRPVFEKAVNETFGDKLAGKPYVMEKIGSNWTSEFQDKVFDTYHKSILCPCLPGDNAREYSIYLLHCLAFDSSFFVLCPVPVSVICTDSHTVIYSFITAQKRFFDIIMSGCLPVVLSFNTSRVYGQRSWFQPGRAPVRSSYPFAKDVYLGMDESDTIDYESFVVQVPDSVDNFKTIMENILQNPKELQRRQEDMAKYAHRLTYGLDQEAYLHEDALYYILKMIQMYLKEYEQKQILSGSAPETIDNTNASQVALTSDKTSKTLSALSNEKGIDRDSRPNDMKNLPRPQLTNRLLKRFIIIPEKKLLFCYVEKVGCSMFNHLFRMLRLSLPDISEEEAEYQANFTWYRNTPWHHGTDKTQLENMLVDPEWTKAVFYRDPVTRFLSAFRSKCERGRDSTPNCKRAFGDRHASFDHVLNQVKNGTLPLDPHFTPASEFCGGLGATLDYYDVVHELKAETAPSHVDALLRKIGVEPVLAQSLVDNVVRTRGMSYANETEQLAARLNVSVGIGKTQSEVHNTESNDRLCDYFNTSEKLSLIQSLFRVDYETFGMKPRGVNCTFEIE